MRPKSVEMGLLSGGMKLFKDCIAWDGWDRNR